MFNQSSIYVVLVCLLLASCSANKVSFNPITHSKVSEGGIAFLKERTMFSVGSGLININGEIKSFKPFAVSLIPEQSVMKVVQFNEGGELPMRFLLSDTEIQIDFESRRFKLDKSDFNEDGEVTIQALFDGSSPVITDFKLYLKT